MKLWTSRYHNAALRQHPAAKVAISLGIPKWPLPYELVQVRELAPAGWLLAKSHAGMSDEDFERAYRHGLYRLTVPRIRSLLEPLDEGHGLVLLCWEDLTKPETTCHRRMFARWWEEQTGERIADLEEEHAAVR